MSGKAAGSDNLHTPYQDCTLCPRNCRVDRLRGERGICGESAKIRIAWAGLHRGEEPPLIGGNGSGTIFFSGCALKCGTCQNCQISHRGLGREVSGIELSALLLRLQEAGAANINLVTAGHFTPSVVESVANARGRGLSIPVVWNCSGYEKPLSLDLLRETVDVYLPDCKTLDAEVSRRLMGAPDYPEVVRAALLKMVEDKPLSIEGGQVRQGVIVRHLVLPGLLSQSREVLEWFAAQLEGRAQFSLMLQYTPVSTPVSMEGGEGRLSGRVNRREYEQVLSWLGELGIDDGYLQEPAASDGWLPDFTRSNPFPKGQAVPVWHCQSGPVR